MNNTALKNAQKFLREYNIRKLSLDRLTDIITEQGYKIVRFSKLYNDENTETLINELNLSKYVRAYSAFTYVDRELRIVFFLRKIFQVKKR